MVLSSSSSFFFFLFFLSFGNRKFLECLGMLNKGGDEWRGSSRERNILRVFLLFSFGEKMCFRMCLGIEEKGRRKWI